MTTYKFSKHALNKHENEKWNAFTIRQAVESGNYEFELLVGKTADILCGSIDGDFVGLVLSKELNGITVIVTGFAAPREYWLNV